MENIGQYVLVALVLGWIVVRQVRGRYVQSGRLAVLPAILVVIGLGSAASVAWTGAAVAVVAGELVITAALGAVRGALTHLTLREGYLYQRGGALGLALWVVSIGARVLTEVWASAIGLGAAAQATITLSFGVSLAAQFVVLSLRVRADGRPLRPSGRGRRPAAERATLDR
jgi:hypothetical protein